MIVLRDTRSDHPSLRYTIGSAAGTKWKLLSFHMHSNGFILVVYCIILMPFGHIEDGMGRDTDAKMSP